MRQLTSEGIILSRTDFGEADRIITMLTADSGKLRLVARGVRKMKSKLAGGIELFSVSHITYIKGRGELDTLISTRLITHYEHIVKDITRTMLGYELIKVLHKATEDEPEPEYFSLLQHAFISLDDPTVDIAVIRLWFVMQLLKLGGHMPNLRTDTAGAALAADQTYNIDFDAMTFAPAAGGDGRFTANHIKFLRLGFSTNNAKVLSQVQGSAALAEAVSPLLVTMQQTYIRM